MFIKSNSFGLICLLLTISTCCSLQVNNLVSPKLPKNGPNVSVVDVIDVTATNQSQSNDEKRVKVNLINPYVIKANIVSCSKNVKNPILKNYTCHLEFHTRSAKYEIKGLQVDGSNFGDVNIFRVGDVKQLSDIKISESDGNVYPGTGENLKSPITYKQFSDNVPLHFERKSLMAVPSKTFSQPCTVYDVTPRESYLCVHDNMLYVNHLYGFHAEGSGVIVPIRYSPTGNNYVDILQSLEGYLGDITAGSYTIINSERDNIQHVVTLYDIIGRLILVTLKNGKAETITPVNLDGFNEFTIADYSNSNPGNDLIYKGTSSLQLDLKDNLERMKKLQDILPYTAVRTITKSADGASICFAGQWSKFDNPWACRSNDKQNNTFNRLQNFINPTMVGAFVLAAHMHSINVPKNSFTYPSPTSQEESEVQDLQEFKTSNITSNSLQETGSNRTTTTTTKTTNATTTIPIQAPKKDLYWFEHYVIAQTDRMMLSDPELYYYFCRFLASDYAVGRPGDIAAGFDRCSKKKIKQAPSDIVSLKKPLKGGDHRVCGILLVLFDTHYEVFSPHSPIVDTLYKDERTKEVPSTVLKPFQPYKYNKLYFHINAAMGDGHVVYFYTYLNTLVTVETRMEFETCETMTRFEFDWSTMQESRNGWQRHLAKYKIDKSVSQATDFIEDTRSLAEGDNDFSVPAQQPHDKIKHPPRIEDDESSSGSSVIILMLVGLILAGILICSLVYFLCLRPNMENEGELTQRNKVLMKKSPDTTATGSSVGSSLHPFDTVRSRLSSATKHSKQTPTSSKASLKSEENKKQEGVPPKSSTEVQQQQQQQQNTAISPTKSQQKPTSSPKSSTQQQAATPRSPKIKSHRSSSPATPVSSAKTTPGSAHTGSSIKSTKSHGSKSPVKLGANKSPNKSPKQQHKPKSARNSPGRSPSAQSTKSKKSRGASPVGGPVSSISPMVAKKT